MAETEELTVFYTVPREAIEDVASSMPFPGMTMAVLGVRVLDVDDVERLAWVLFAGHYDRGAVTELE